MSDKINPEALEALIKGAGLGDEAAAQLRAANNASEPPAADQPKGHGAASEKIVPFGDL
jgi:hypothetical protein